MRLLPGLWSSLGLAAVVATLLLSAPGVRIGRADGQEEPASAQQSTQDPARVRALENAADAAGQAPSPSSSPGPSCSSEGSKPSMAGLEAKLAAQLSAIRAARTQEPEGVDGGVIVLNGRGYNYGPAPGLEDTRPRRREAR